MTALQFIDKQLGRLPGWPSERQMVTYINVALIAMMLWMAKSDAALWDVEVFKVILQALALTGFLNMAMAFFFAANKSDEVKSQNTAAAFRAIEATANAGGTQPHPDVVLKPGETAQAEEAK